MAKLVRFTLPLLLLGFTACDDPLSVITVPTDHAVAIPSPTPAAPAPTATPTVGGGGGHAHFVGRDDLTLDLLIVFDNSGSMDDKRKALVDSLNDLILALSRRRGIDMRAAVTVTDGDFLDKCQLAWYRNLYPTDCAAFDGTLLKGAAGSIATTASATFASDVADILSRLPETPSRGWEQGLRSLEAVLQYDGARWQRPGVPTVALVFTDAEDQSCDPSVSRDDCYSWRYRPLDHYVKLLRGARSAVQFIPFAGRADSHCTIESTGYRYFSLASLLGQQDTGSICADEIHDGLLSAASRLEGRGNCFTLPADAAGASALTVTVDGKTVAASAASGYTYDAASRSLCFPGTYNPAEGASIDVTYH